MLRIILFIACYMASQSMIAQSPKIGVVDLDIIFSKSIFYQTTDKSFDSLGSDLQDIIDKKQVEMAPYLKKVAEHAQKCMNGEEIETTKVLQAMQDTLLKMAKTAEKELKNAENKIIILIHKELYQIIDYTRDSLEYDFILDRKGVIFNTNKLTSKDLTQLVLKLLNKQYDSKKWNTTITPILEKVLQRVHSKGYSIKSNFEN